MKEKRVACIYHAIDLDGWMSAAIVKHWFRDRFQIKGLREQYDSSKDTLDFIGYNYGDPIPDLSKYDKVIMCDISFPKEEMRKIAENYHFIWIDHHISALKDNAYLIDLAQCEDSNINLKLDPRFAACELTWKYFFPDETMPELIRLLGRYDCFGHKGTDEEQKVLEFQYGARQCIRDYNEAYNGLVITKDDVLYSSGQYFDNVLNQIHANGKAIYKYLCTEAEQAYTNGFEIYFRYSPNIPEHRNLGFTDHTIYRFICINKERFNPINFGIDYHKDGYDGCASYFFDGNTYIFSLYNDNGELDCSNIAKQFGGGGHKGAAGFRITTEQFNKFIK